MPLPHRKLLTSDLTKHSAFRFNKLTSFLRGTPKDDLIKAAIADGNTLIRGRGGVDLLHGNAGNDLIFGGGGDDSIYAGDGDDIVFGGQGDDLIHGDGGNDVLSGGGGMDNIFGGDGDDVLVGGRSFDLLMGNAGNDTFVFRRGDGNDTILTETELASRRNSGSDTVYFANLRAEQLHSVRMETELAGDGADGVSLVIDYGQGDRVTIKNQERLGVAAIDTFRFADNRELSAEGLLMMYSGKGGTLASNHFQRRSPAPTQMQFHLNRRGKPMGAEFPHPATAVANTSLYGIVADASHNAPMDPFPWQESLRR